MPPAVENTMVRSQGMPHTVVNTTVEKPGHVTCSGEYHGGEARACHLQWTAPRWRSQGMPSPVENTTVALKILQKLELTCRNSRHRQYFMWKIKLQDHIYSLTMFFLKVLYFCGYWYLHESGSQSLHWYVGGSQKWGQADTKESWLFTGPNIC